jgi:hypothetical protein
MHPVPFKNALEPALSLPPLSSATLDQKVKILLNFFKATESRLEEGSDNSSKLTNAAFIQALLGAFGEICLATNERHGDYKEDSFSDVLQPLSTFNWDNHAGTNKKAVSELTNAIVAAIRGPKRISDDML